MASRRPQKVPIFVRLNSNTNIPVQIDLQWNVLKLKEEIAAQQGVDPTEIRIIFAGRELKDDLQLKVLLTFYITYYSWSSHKQPPPSSPPWECPGGRGYFL